MTAAMSASVKGKGRRAERLVRDYLRAVLPTEVSVERAARTGSSDEGDVKVIHPGGVDRYTIEVKYRSTRPGPAALAEMRRQAEVEAAFYGADRAILVINVPGSTVGRWIVHFRPLGPEADRWLMGEVEDWLTWVLEPKAAARMEGMFRWPGGLRSLQSG